MNKEQLKRILISELEYSEHSAEQTAKDLLSISDLDLLDALEIWVKDRTVSNISQGKYSIYDLLKKGLKYPACLIFLDWYREDPETAEKAMILR